jgi:hypothetical protein
LSYSVVVAVWDTPMRSLENWWFIDIDNCTDWYRFLGSIAKLSKTTISFVMSVRLSARSHGTTGFHW